MANVGRKLGFNIRAFMIEAGISDKELAESLHYSVKEVWNVIEGKIVVPPVELDKISRLLGKTKDQLINDKTYSSVPDLQYMKEFSNLDNLDKILDLMDEYVELKEAM